MPLDNAAAPASSINEMMADALTKSESGATPTSDTAAASAGSSTGASGTVDTASALDSAQEPRDGETAEQAAQRARDEKGRFTAAPADKAQQQPVQAAQAPAPKPRPPRPTTWKKDYWDHWEKIDPTLAEYLVQRESEFASGVSTYATKWREAEPLVNAIAPFQPLLQQHGIQPDKWIQSLGHAQQVLALGTPEQKLGMLQNLAQTYQIPLERLLQGAAAQAPADGQQPPVQDPRVNQLTQQVTQLSSFVNDFRSQQQRQQDEAIRREIDGFKAKPGNEHYEQVRETMAGLLQSGLADDLQSAYDAALRHPRHADIYEPIQRQQREEAERKSREAAAAAARTARSAAASVRTTTPSAANAGKSGAKDVRSMMSDSLDEVSAGRV